MDGSPSAFVADVMAAGLGRKDLTGADARESLLRIGESVVDGLRGGVPVDDLVRGLFDSPARPTKAQAETLVESAIRNLAPDCLA